MSDGATQQTPPRVFISYSHDSPEHAERVLDLTSRLRRDGMDARIDRYEPNPPQGWPRWCAEQILAADFTLLVCTRTYRERFLGLDAYGQGRGVKWEARIIQNVLYYSEVNTGFLPVVFRAEDAEQIPEALRDATQYLVAASRSEDEGYRKLLRTLARGREWPSLDVPAPDLQPQPADASVPTDAVWGESEQVAAGLERIEQAQQTHERSSRYRHWALMALVLLTLAGLGWLGWQQWETRTAVTDPVVLKAQLENRISETFDTKLGTLKQQGAPPKEIDALYRWRERVEGQLNETVNFIQTASETERRSLAAAAARVLEERGVDAALEMLEERLSEASERHKAHARELAEAAMFKAKLHQTRLEHDQTREALGQAIELEHGWWEPHNQLGMLALDLADWKEAERAFRQARLLVTEETDEATVINNLAQLLQATNRLGEAEPLMRRALTIDEASYGPEHPKVAIELNNLALLLQATNRLGEAEPLMRRAQVIDEASYGPEHPAVAIRLNNLAALLQATNNLGKAEPLMRRALVIDEASLGPEHPNVAIRLNNLALLLKATNRPGEAEPLMRRALAIDEASLGPEHPTVAIRLNNLATLLQDTNRLGEAEPLMRRALAIDKASLGPEHPKVAIELNNLATLLQDTNRLGEAEPLMRRVLVIFLKFTRDTGHPHPHLRAAVDNYRKLLGAMALAEEELERRIVAVGAEAGFGEEDLRQLLDGL